MVLKGTPENREPLSVPKEGPTRSISHEPLCLPFPNIPKGTFLLYLQSLTWLLAPHPSTCLHPLASGLHFLCFLASSWPRPNAMSPVATPSPWNCLLHCCFSSEPCQRQHFLLCPSSPPFPVLTLAPELSPLHPRGV